MKMSLRLVGKLMPLLAAVQILQPLMSFATLEQTFDVLQVGTRVYTNVTVTTKSKSYVFILHSAGMTNLKVADLPGDVLQKLGYDDPSVPKVQTNGAAAWAKQTMGKLQATAVVTNLEQQIKTNIRSHGNPRELLAASLPFPVPELTMTLVLGFFAVCLLLHLFHSYCCMLICRKAGAEPGILVWLPVLQTFPMLRAAKMSAWWFVGLLVPLLNIIGAIMWCFRIADARNKSALIGLFLLLPVLNFFAFLFLAFSDGNEPGNQKGKGSRPVQIMTLEAA